jgi:hypothetical protein
MCVCRKLLDALPLSLCMHEVDFDTRRNHTTHGNNNNRNAPKGPRRYAQLEADGEEDDEKLVEEAAYHDRAWDDWKDDHPRGMGNKAGKRF